MFALTLGSEPSGELITPPPGSFLMKGLSGIGDVRWSEIGVTFSARRVNPGDEVDRISSLFGPEVRGRRINALCTFRGGEFIELPSADGACERVSVLGDSLVALFGGHQKAVFRLVDNEWTEIAKPDGAEPCSGRAVKVEGMLLQEFICNFRHLYRARELSWEPFEPTGTKRANWFDVLGGSLVGEFLIGNSLHYFRFVDGDWQRLGPESATAAHRLRCGASGSFMAYFKIGAKHQWMRETNGEWEVFGPAGATDCNWLKKIRGCFVGQFIVDGTSSLWIQKDGTWSSFGPPGVKSVSDIFDFNGRTIAFFYLNRAEFGLFEEIDCGWTRLAPPGSSRCRWCAEHDGTLIAECLVGRTYRFFQYANDTWTRLPFENGTIEFATKVGGTSVIGLKAKGNYRPPMALYLRSESGAWKCLAQSVSHVKKVPGQDALAFIETNEHTRTLMKLDGLSLSSGPIAIHGPSFRCSSYTFSADGHILRLIGAQGSGEEAFGIVAQIDL